MKATQSLANHFLIALPSLKDPFFERSVTYICEHNAEGAFGIIINLPMEANLQELFDFFELASPQELQATTQSTPLLAGGPVEKERGFILHSPIGQWETSLKVSESIALTTSEDILKAIAEGVGPEHYVIALGYSGWSAGQLEEELQDNAWLFAPAQTELLFSTPYEQRWEASHHLLGVNLSQISNEHGTA